MPKSIPLYDETAAIACTITDGEIPGRIEVVERLRGAATTVERTAVGMLLFFPDSEATRADLSEFVVDEKRCCQFWGFGFVDKTNGVALRWEGPPRVSSLLDKLYDYFTGTAPISSIHGLL